MSFYGLVDGTDASLRKYLGALSGVEGKTNGVAVDRGGNGRALPVKGKRRRNDVGVGCALPRATPPRQSRVNRNLKSLF